MTKFDRGAIRGVQRGVVESAGKGGEMERVRVRRGGIGEGDADVPGSQDVLR